MPFERHVSSCCLPDFQQRTIPVTSVGFAHGVSVSHAPTGAALSPVAMVSGVIGHIGTTGVAATVAVSAGYVAIGAYNKGTKCVHVCFSSFFSLHCPSSFSCINE